MAKVFLVTIHDNDQVTGFDVLNALQSFRRLKGWATVTEYPANETKQETPKLFDTNEVWERCQRLKDEVEE